MGFRVWGLGFRVFGQEAVGFLCGDWLWKASGVQGVWDLADFHCWASERSKVRIQSFRSRVDQPPISVKPRELVVLRFEGLQVLLQRFLDIPGPQPLNPSHQPINTSTHQPINPSTHHPATHDMEPAPGTAGCCFCL